MNQLRVLVVDDSVVMRRMVREVLSSDPAVDVVGVAANGRIALAMIEQLSPDALTLDMEMPEMNGLDTLRTLRPLYPALHVIMFCTLNEQGAAAAMDALALGADDYVTKSSGPATPAEAAERIRTQLLPRLKALCSRPAAAPRQVPNRFAIPPAASLVPTVERVDILAIGTSTGGPNALAVVLPLLPRDLAVPVVIVQHMPPTFTRYLSERLSASCNIPVVEAAAGDVLSPGKAWIAPGDYHITLKSDCAKIVIQTNQQVRENSCRPSVDVLFRSVAEVYGRHTLALVMTGMGQDGLRGCELLRAAGAQIIVQDEATSVVWGMPGFVARAGLADEVLPLSAIGAALVRRIAVGRPLAAGTYAR